MNQDKREIAPSQLVELRKSGKIAPHEFAYVAGDLVVAENATTGERRVIGNTSLLLESGRQVLKG